MEVPKEDQLQTTKKGVKFGKSQTDESSIDKKDKEKVMGRSDIRGLCPS